MPGITDLETLLRSLRPRLHEGEFIFCTLPHQGYGASPELEPVASFREAEGLTLVIPRERADAAAIAYSGVFRMITLEVHSSLEAVGMTAAVATRLTERGISANVIAAFHHDHLLVPAARAKEALDLLSS